ncbi:hypothetical protein KDW_27890 [Dictyobacter vulcani]|uniref:Uncharacterized protein n=1 Tax=Dictyobacter vulcani TaxID=2607529 RepID=A0A5J4KQB4_9CHLR|nr:hypothetical protein [Dictyobacter vulcani]GER88627.1 hypothetical protein KDW_27890 [Dictyobacter vulcani]
MLTALQYGFSCYTCNRIAPIGSYLNLRTRVIRQLTAPATLPPDGYWARIDPSPTQSIANIARTINKALGTAYSAENFQRHKDVPDEKP